MSGLTYKILGLLLLVLLVTALWFFGFFGVRFDERQSKDSYGLNYDVRVWRNGKVIFRDYNWSIHPDDIDTIKKFVSREVKAKVVKGQTGGHGHNWNRNFPEKGKTIWDLYHQIDMQK